MSRPASLNQEISVHENQYFDFHVFERAVYLSLKTRMTIEMAIN